MKTWVVVVAGIVFACGASVEAADDPHGELLELHSCQLYIGGCIASSEATLEGRYLLRVWNFSGGACNGTPLRGLTAALLEVADQNLAMRGVQPTESVIYLPQSANAAQNTALVGWLKTANPEIAGTKSHTRTVPMKLSRAGTAYSFSAGDSVRIESRRFEPCGLISCGESLWYKPRSTMTSYTVGVTSTAVIYEPALGLRWVDHGKNNIFEGRFDETAATTAAFIPPAFACAVANHPTHD